MLVDFGLRVLDRTAYHDYYHGLYWVNQSKELLHLRFGLDNLNNAIKDASMEQMKLGCLIPAFLQEAGQRPGLSHDSDGIRTYGFPIFISKS